METIQKLLSRKKIPTVHYNEPIGSVFENVKSSHDAIFVKDDRNNIIGVVSITNALFRRRFPPDTKIGHTVITPPHITRNTSIFDTARHMVATRLYKLPVFVDGHIEGIITAKSILKYLLANENLLKKVSAKISLDRLETAGLHASVGEVYKKLKKEATSHIVITDDKGKLLGIIARKDIKEAFLAPSRTNRNGKNKGVATRSTNFEEEDITRFDFPIGEYMKVNAITVPVGTQYEIALQKMLENNVNSVVFVTGTNTPRAILTVYAFLKALSKQKPAATFELKLTDKDNVIPYNIEQSIQNITKRFGSKIDKADPIKNIELTVKQYRNINHKKTGYEIHVRVHSYDGKGYMTKVENKLLLTGIREAFKKIQHQQG